MRKSTIKARFEALKEVFGTNIPKTITKRKVIKSVGTRFSETLIKCGISQDIIAKIDTAYDILKSEFAYLNRVNEKTLKLIKLLRKQNKKIILITKKKSEEALSALRQFGIESLFDEIVTDSNYKEAYDNYDAEKTAIIGNMAEQDQSCFTFLKSSSNYGNILTQKIAFFVTSIRDFITSLFTSTEKYFLQGFT